MDEPKYGEDFVSSMAIRLWNGDTNLHLVNMEAEGLGLMLKDGSDMLDCFSLAPEQAEALRNWLTGVLEGGN